MALVVTLLVAGCAGQETYQEGVSLVEQGKFTEGLVKLDDALRLDPGNVEYRATLINSRTRAVSQLLSQAENARRQQRLADAERLYRAVLRLDEQNTMAWSGLERLAAARRHGVAIKDAEDRFKKNDLQEAADILRSVLAENPQHKEAKELQARIDEKKTQDKSAEKRLSAAVGRSISIELRDASLSTVFDLIAHEGGINVFYDKDVKTDAKVSLNAKNTTVEDAIRLLLLTNQLEQRILNDNSILIYPNTPQKQKDYQPMMVRSFLLANADAKQVANTFKTILKTRDMVVDEKLNLIIIRDTPEVIRLAEKLVAVEDIGESEVMLDVEVIEVQRSRLTDLGIRWPDQLTLSVGNAASTTATTAATTTGTNSFTLQDLRSLNSSKVNAALTDLVINAKKQDTDTNLLANPRIRVRNKEKAKIMIGDKVPVITTTSTATGFVSGNVNYVDVGLKLDVEPNIFLDEEVAIKLSLEVSSIVKQITTQSGTVAYQIGTRNASTVLKLKDGETQILGGLINNQDTETADKVPGLGDLPLLGRLFGSRNTNKVKTEIILTITPHLVRTMRRADLVVAEFDSGTESSVGARALTLSPTPVERPTTANGNIPGKNPASASPTPNGKVLAEVSAAGNASRAAGAEAMAESFNVAWVAPSQLRSGEQFTAMLRLQSAGDVASVPFVVAFDPEMLQVVSVAEGDFLRHGGGQTQFSSRIDAQAGQIYVDATRESGAATGVGNVATVTFRAVRPVSETSLRLVSVSPDPMPPGTPSMPIVHTLSIIE